MEHILLVLFICKIINVYPLWPRCMWLVLYSWLCFRCGGEGEGCCFLCVSPLLQFLCLCWFPVSCSSQLVFEVFLGGSNAWRWFGSATCSLLLVSSSLPGWMLKHKHKHKHNAGLDLCNAGYTMFRGSVKGTGYPLHSPVSISLPLPCVSVCHHISTGVYKWWLCRKSKLLFQNGAMITFKIYNIIKK